MKKTRGRQHSVRTAAAHSNRVTARRGAEEVCFHARCHLQRRTNKTSNERVHEQRRLPYRMKRLPLSVSLRERERARCSDVCSRNGRILGSEAKGSRTKAEAEAEAMCWFSWRNLAFVTLRRRRRGHPRRSTCQRKNSASSAIEKTSFYRHCSQVC